MLSDPISMTISGVAKTLPRSAAPKGRVYTKVATSDFNTSDGEFNLKIERFVSGDYVRTQAILRKNDLDDLDGRGYARAESFGIVYDCIPTSDEKIANLAALRSALLTFIDTGIESRIINGEM